MPRSYQRPRQSLPKPTAGAMLASPEIWPEKSWRYVNSWDDEHVIVNVSHNAFRDSGKLKRLELGEIVMDVRGGLSPYQTPMRLREFPTFLKSLKIGLNTVFARNDAGETWMAANQFVQNSVRFYIWCIRHAIHSLSDLTPADVKKCVQEVERQGWFRVLCYQDAMRRLLSRAKNDHRLALSLKGTGEPGYATINIKAVEQEIGLPLPPHGIPNFLAQGLCRIYRDTRKQPLRPALKLQDTRVLVHTLQLLSLFPPYADSIRFFPDHSLRNPQNKKVGRHKGRDGRTQNLPLPQALALLEQSLRWAFDYFPAIIQLVEVVLDAFESNRGKDYIDLQHEMTTELQRAYPEVRDKYGLPFSEIELNRGENSLRSMVGFLMTAIVCLIAINHGRRRNEILGQRKVYGLYVGCVQPVSPASDNHKIDVYIEKSLRDYATLWCNVLVRRCVEKLELLRRLTGRYNLALRKLQLEVEQKSDLDEVETHALRRRQKLFVLNRFSEFGLTREMSDYNWDTLAPKFFSMAGLDIREFPARTHPFRRLFAVLYVYRYDCPELLALSRHFFHLTIEQTRIYVTDPKSRKQKDRLAALFGMTKEDMMSLEDMLAKTRTEYLAQKLEDLLHGKLLGGGFPRLVLRFIRQLSRYSEFVELSTKDKARLVTQRLEDIGYKVNERENGPCMIGTISRGLRKANCYHEGSIHPERSSPKTCQNCSFSMTTETTIMWLEEDRDRARADAQNIRLSPALRLAATREADIRDATIALEKNFSEETARQYAIIVNTWPVREAA